MEKRNEQLLITEILSRAFNICKDNVLEILKSIGIFMVPSFILTMVISFTFIAAVFFSISYIDSYTYYDNSFSAIGAGAIFIIIIVGIIAGILSLFGTFVITKILDDANKGNEVSWKSATKYIWKKKWSALGLSILVSLMMCIAITVLIILGTLFSLITLGIGAIIAVPLIIAIIVVIIPLCSLFNSSFVVNDLGAIDAITETFHLFRKGYFWSTVGRLAAISGISILLVIGLVILDFIPILGSILSVIFPVVISIYVSAYLNIFVLDRTKPQIDNFLGNSGDDNNQDDGFIDPIV
ncbi:hypothetical protein ACQPVP_13435 [Clostridium nigeriense]|uniref:hypothetical protein n=1 Tax=Clostridium nigeriense TaxID=1805470 RepID=UPI003D3284A9